MTQNKIQAFKQEMSEIYVAINEGKFTFPEFADKPKKHRKECSLRAHSIMQRYMRKLEGQDEDLDDQRQTS